MGEETFTRVGDYEVLGVLGAGGMGKVYKVRNSITNRVEAMKVLLPDLADRRELADRFLREIKLLAELCHPNIATLRTALTWNNQLVMIMEYVEGVTLAARVKRGPLPSTEAVDYIRQVLSALSYAHGLHIIHRDIKPANMMVTPQSLVKLMDFGIARAESDPVLTASGSTLGSVHYMSPEQVKGEPADERSDIYSVGVSLYELVTGQRPFDADNEYAVMAGHLQRAPAPPNTLRNDLPPGLNDIILMAMEKNPAQRFQSADAFRNALQSLRVGAPEAGSVSPVRERDEDVTGTVASPPTSVISAVMRGAAEEHGPIAQAAQATATVDQGVVAPKAALQSPGVPPAPATTSQSNQLELKAPPAIAAATNGAATQGPSAQQAASPAARQAVPSVLGASTPVSAYRGLYLALGSLIVLVLLVAAGIYIPRMNRTHAGGDRAGIVQPVSPAAPAIPDSSSPPVTNSNRPASSTSAATGGSALPVVSEPTPSSPASAEKNPTRDGGEGLTGGKPTRAISRSGEPTPASPPPRGAAQDPRASVIASGGNVPPLPAAPPSDTGQLQQLEHDADLLASRADAVDESLNGIRQNQAAQGLGLRGDIAASQQRMRTYMTKAQSALKGHDSEGAKKYLQLAEAEVASLEKFLGR